MIALLYCAMDKLNLIVVATLETIVICLFCIHSVENALYLFDSRKKHMYWWMVLTVINGSLAFCEKISVRMKNYYHWWMVLTVIISRGCLDPSTNSRIVVYW